MVRLTIVEPVKVEHGADVYENKYFIARFPQVDRSTEQEITQIPVGCVTKSHSCSETGKDPMI